LSRLPSAPRNTGTSSRLHLSLPRGSLVLKVSASAGQSVRGVFAVGHGTTSRFRPCAVSSGMAVPLALHIIISRGISVGSPDRFVPRERAGMHIRLGVHERSILTSSFTSLDHSWALNRPARQVLQRIAICRLYLGYPVNHCGNVFAFVLNSCENLLRHLSQ
jgi:hypothetical protein